VAALYLVAAGVGRVGLVDGGRVDLPDLQRQVLYRETDLGRPKVEAAAEALNRLNNKVELEVHLTYLSPRNARQLVSQYAVILDGSDNFPTRYLVNDATFLEKRPLVYGSVFRLEGQVSVFNWQGGPCYRCLYPEPPAAGMVVDCAQGGVLGPVAGLVGSMQATEVLKLLAGVGQPLAGRLWMIQADLGQISQVKVQRNPQCPLCGSHRFINELVDYETFCGSTFPGTETHWSFIMAGELADRLKKQSWDVLDVRRPMEQREQPLKNGIVLPLETLHERYRELDPGKEYLVVCNHGVRSALACDFLWERGFRRLYNLQGGMAGLAPQQRKLLGLAEKP